RLNVTLFAGRPTRGNFQVDGWGELNSNIFYGALTGNSPGKRINAEWRIFGLGYSDYRDNVSKQDNRPSAARIADGQHIHVGTYGGNYVVTAASRAGTVDLLFWG